MTRWTIPGIAIIAALRAGITGRIRVLRQLLTVQKSYQDTHFPIHFRARNDVERIVEELELVEPGITWTTSWPAAGPAPGPAVALPACFAAVGRVPQP